MRNKKKKSFLLDMISVLAVTLIVVVALLNIRDWINHTEAVRAMENLSRIVTEYRAKYQQVPPESYVERIKEELEGYARFGGLKYRALWIGFDSAPDEILAYLERDYLSWFLRDGFIVLKLDGDVVMMGKDEFKELLAKQQSTMEIKMTEQ